MNRTCVHNSIKDYASMHAAMDSSNMTEQLESINQVYMQHLIAFYASLHAELAKSGLNVQLD